MNAKAFAPANISCIFQIHEDSDPSKMGSYGLGFTLNEGVTVEVSLATLNVALAEKKEVFFNGKKIAFPTVLDVIANLASEVKQSRMNKEDIVYETNGIASSLTAPRNDVVSVRVSITSPLPLGCGFGLSGASALATAYAMNTLLDTQKTNLELAKIAHIAEVENKTGLGDVVNQYFGGFLLKTVPSSQFEVQRIPIENIPVYCKYFGEISTKDVISDEKMKEKINNAAKAALEKVKRASSQRLASSGELFAQLIASSKEFTQKSGLLKSTEVIQTIQEIESRGGHASMIMLGNAVFSDIPFEGAKELFISNNPAKVL